MIQDRNGPIVNLDTSDLGLPVEYSYSIKDSFYLKICISFGELAPQPLPLRGPCCTIFSVRPFAHSRCHQLSELVATSPFLKSNLKHFFLGKLLICRNSSACSAILNTFTLFWQRTLAVSMFLNKSKKVQVFVY